MYDVFGVRGRDIARFKNKVAPQEPYLDDQLNLLNSF